MIKLSQASAFIIFYAIFLGAMLSSMDRHSAFDSASIFRKRPADRPLLRFLFGIAFLNVLPVVVFFWWYQYMNRHEAACTREVILAVTVCFTIFACNRLYSTVAGLFKALHPKDTDNEYSPLDHFLGAIPYIIIPLAVFFVLK